MQMYVHEYKHIYVYTCICKCVYLYIHVSIISRDDESHAFTPLPAGVCCERRFHAAEGACFRKQGRQPRCFLDKDTQSGAPNNPKEAAGGEFQERGLYVSAM